MQSNITLMKVLCCIAIAFAAISNMAAQPGIRITDKGQIVPLYPYSPIRIGHEAGESAPSNNSYVIAIGRESLKDYTGASHNIAIGYFSMQNTNTGSSNVALGNFALSQNEFGSFNTAIGMSALSSGTGYDNTAVGASALSSNTGSQNSALGSYALASNTSANDNTAAGFFALFINNTGARNTGIGVSSLYYNVSGAENTALGYHSGVRNSGASSKNVYLGAFAGAGSTNVVRHNTVMIGHEAGLHSSGSDNVLVGYQAGTSISGSKNVFLGYQAGIGATGSNKLYIANTNTSTPLIYGEFDNRKLEFNGQLEIKSLHTHALVWDDNNVTLKKNADAIVSRRNNFRVLLDSDNNSGANCTFELYSNVDTSGGAAAKVLFALDGGHSWINSGNLGLGSTSPQHRLDVNGTVRVGGNTNALLWDNGLTLLKNSADAIVSKRHIFRILLDSDNNDGGTSGQARFQLFSNVDTSGTHDPKVNLNLDGGASWINSGNMGIGLTNPDYTLDVAGVINASAGLSGTALRVQGDQAIWYNGVHFSWGFDGQWNRFADSVRIGGGTSPTHLLQVDGVARSTQSTWATSSDLRVKHTIEDIADATGTLMQFRPVTFQWTDAYASHHPVTKEKTYGFIAQQVEEVIPSMVTTVREIIGETVIEDFKVLSTDALIPLLVRTVQEQQAHIDTQQANLHALEVRLAAMEKLLTTSDKTLSVSVD